jgi:hypothetical protein
MNRVDQAFGAITEAPRKARIAPHAFGIAPGIGTIHRHHAGRDAFDQKALPRVNKLEAIRSALGAKIGGKIFGCHQAGRDTPARFGDRPGLHQAAREFDIRQQRRRPLRYPIVALEGAHRLVQPRDINGFGDFRQCHDIGTPAHHGGEVVHAALRERVDAHRGDSSRLAPFRIELASQRPRRGAQGRRRKVLKLLDQDIGAA